MTSGRVVALGLEYEEEKRAGLFTMGILVSTIAMALGSGHVWRFPRVAALIGPTLDGVEDETEMSLSGYIVMTVILSGIWGGFAYLLYQTLKREGRS